MKRKVIDLGGEWRALWIPADFNPPETWPIKPWDEALDDAMLLPVKMPGELNTELLRHGLIRDPFFEKANEERRWVEEVDWWLRRRFELPEDLSNYRKVELIIDGLDTFADIWINGAKVYEADDMFVEHRIDVTGRCRPGENLLAIRIRSPAREAIKRERRKLWVGIGGTERVWARKAQYQWGWDWAPRLLTAGILRGIRIELLGDAVIRDVFVYTLKLEPEKATIKVVYEIENLAGRELDATVEFAASCEDSAIEDRVKLKLRPDVNRVERELEVERPRLWWPAGLGPQSIYRGRARLLVGGEVVDEREVRFGIRTVELRTEGDETPNRKVFYFVINGVKVFAKGANWIPLDLLLGRLTREKYRRILELTAKANHNMLRIWGGGIVVEPEWFYELCDELGIMVWQEFPFACAEYPEDEDYLEKVRKEAEDIVRRLRNHPCIVLWCGNNENEWLLRGIKGRLYRHKIDFEVLADVCARLDPSRPYWPSSPWGGDDPNSPEEGDRHNWDVWHRMMPVESYEEDEARFLSEFGMQALPCLETLASFLSPAKLWPPNECWLYHYHDLVKMLRYALEVKESLGGLEDYIEATQLAQAFALKTAIEHCRRRKFACGGCMYWSLNAPWPNMCWEVIDYYLRPKAAYWYVRRAYAPVLVSIAAHRDKASAWIVNDTLEEIRGRLRLELRDFEGRMIKEIEEEVKAPANASVKALELDIKEADARAHFVRAVLRSEDGRLLAENTRLLCKPRDARFANANLHVEPVETKLEGDKLTVRLRIKTDKPAFAVNVRAKSIPAERLWPEDNYFDLMPEEARELTISIEGARHAELIVSALNAKPVSIRCEPAASQKG